MDFTSSPSPLRIPAPKPTHAPNGCSLKPLTPKTAEKALLLVCPPWRLTLQVVYRSRPRFQLPKPSSQTDCRPRPRSTQPGRVCAMPPGQILAPGHRAQENAHQSQAPDRISVETEHKARMNAAYLEWRQALQDELVSAMRALPVEPSVRVGAGATALTRKKCAGVFVRGRVQ
jgi:hypothetical protein